MDYATLTALDGALPRIPTPVSELEDVAGPPAPEATGLEEDLVADSRAGLTPAEMVERKLAHLLKRNPLPVSHLMTRSAARTRNP
jgi:hypothetical protein